MRLCVNRTVCRLEAGARRQRFGIGKDSFSVLRVSAVKEVSGVGRVEDDFEGDTLAHGLQCFTHPGKREAVGNDFLDRKVLLLKKPGHFRKGIALDKRPDDGQFLSGEVVLRNSLCKSMNHAKEHHGAARPDQFDCGRDERPYGVDDDVGA